MAIFEEQLTEKTLQAFNQFISCTPIQIVQMIMLDSNEDAVKGREIFWKMFRQTSDYAKQEWGWVQNVLDNVEVPKVAKKKEDPLMNPFLAPFGAGTGCDCGSCGGH